MKETIIIRDNRFIKHIYKQGLQKRSAFKYNADSFTQFIERFETFDKIKSQIRVKLN